MEGYVSRVLNATFIALISKCEKLVSFLDFRPISVCNLVYKMISKIIANRIKLVLAEVVSKEQFGFLGNHQILVAVDLTQEVSSYY